MYQFFGSAVVAPGAALLAAAVLFSSCGSNDQPLAQDTPERSTPIAQESAWVASTPPLPSAATPKALTKAAAVYAPSPVPTPTTSLPEGWTLPPQSKGEDVTNPVINRPQASTVNLETATPEPTHSPDQITAEGNGWYLTDENELVFTQLPVETLTVIPTGDDGLPVPPDQTPPPSVEVWTLPDRPAQAPPTSWAVAALPETPEVLNAMAYCTARLIESGDPQIPLSDYASAVDQHKTECYEIAGPIGSIIHNYELNISCVMDAFLHNIDGRIDGREPSSQWWQCPSRLWTPYIDRLEIPDRSAFMDTCLQLRAELLAAGGTAPPTNVITGQQQCAQYYQYGPPFYDWLGAATANPAWHECVSTDSLYQLADAILPPQSEPSQLRVGLNAIATACLGWQS